MTHDIESCHAGTKLKVCSICAKYFQGWGNNAAPINNGQCCYECNLRVVIPARMRLAARMGLLEEKK